MSVLWQSDLIFYALTLALGVLGVATAAHVLLNKRDPKSAFGWIALSIILPLAGPLLYVLFGINRVHKRARRDYLEQVPDDALITVREPPGTNFRPLSSIGEKLTGHGLSDCTEFRILENGEELYPAMIECINNAQKRIYLASYIFDNNSSGIAIAEALAAAIKRGVEVKVIVDGMGELMMRPRIGVLLRTLGIPFQRFNPITVFPPSLAINMRNHRKLLIIDGEWAFTGGQNIGDRHLAGKLDNVHRVFDIHFQLRGEIVDHMELAFLTDWHYCTDSTEPLVFEGSNTLDMEASIWTRLVLHGPNRDIEKLNRLIVGVISAAQKEVLIMTPYFLPTFDLIGAVVAAQLRGVKVQILLPGFNNIKLIHWATQNTLRQLLEADLDIRYQPAPFVHSKLLLIDGEYALVGSANLDPRSLRLNYELGLEVFSRTVTNSLRDYFLARAEASRSVTLEQVNNRSILVRLRDSLAWLFSPYL